MVRNYRLKEKGATSAGMGVKPLTNQLSSQHRRNSDKQLSGVLLILAVLLPYSATAESGIKNPAKQQNRNLVQPTNLLVESPNLKLIDGAA